MKVNFYVVVCILLFKSFAQAGFDVGNGGDILRCPLFNNYVSLDYALTRGGKNKFTIRKVSSLADSFRKISSVIEKKLPMLSSSFNEFTSQIENHNDYSKRYIWVAEDDLKDVTDEQYLNISSACGPNLSGTVGLYQAVIRKSEHHVGGSVGKVIFNFDPSVLKLIEESPIQLSYLYVHEWLWNFAKDANQVREINKLIHSDQIENMTQQQIIQYMNRLGVSL